MDVSRFRVPCNTKVSLKDYDPGSTGSFRSKEEALKKLEGDVAAISTLQDILYAQDIYALLIIFQAMDAAGKDSAIKHVMSGVNPQGCDVHSFKAPSAEELDHDFLWRCLRVLPERGRIGIFNRSYYEETLVVRVHPELLRNQKLPPQSFDAKFWRGRFEDINAFEQYHVRNGIAVLKFFLHVSKEEQEKRFLERIENPDKNWKFSTADVQERRYWKEYMKAYEEVFRHTSTPWAPWHIIPADHKWFTRVAVSDIILRTLRSLKISYPKVSKARRKELEEARKELEGRRQVSKPVFPA